jgi:adenylate kinase family enzyme
MALPDFLIVGAMKSGTSTLAAQLGAQKGNLHDHPEGAQFLLR